LISGRPHSYSVAAVYTIPKADLPGSATGDGEKKPNGDVDCWFITKQATATGQATGLIAPVLTTPADGHKVIAFGSFRFSSSMAGAFPVQLGYVLQLSKSPKFDDGKVYTSPEAVHLGTHAVAVTLKPRFPGDNWNQFLADVIGVAKTTRDANVYWRVGVRNIADVPGPSPDPTTGLRYTFGLSRSFVRP
jgi:hypothetical protein